MSAFDEDSPRGTTSLRSRGSPLAPAAEQRRVLEELPLGDARFDAALAGCGWPRLEPAKLEIFQINVGKLCNMTCRHCHVDAGPDRAAESMDRATIDACLAALDKTDAHTIDITGGAPELSPHFRYLVEACVARGKRVIDRCNLTVLLLPRFADLPGWLGERGVEIVASLPHFRQRGTDQQRGIGTYERSIQALQRLNDAGYGQDDSRRRLTLMHNPPGAYLPGAQRSMEREWKDALKRQHGVTFDRLIALSNMPISRYLEWLLESGNLQGYMERLVAAFNPGAVAGMMCRNTLSVAWDGSLYDCDFNQMLEIPITRLDGRVMRIHELDLALLASRAIRTARHCYGCAAGAGSSCGGATA